ncbi:DUF3667 domain-containing protein [Chryseobacterium sp. Tr-659]|uniref:DUF3667 domain-containing protein n=1 Tax=Chryseobacterium sp. Tr-659 TaxID=2608340 RepID=UPI001421EF2F|nr:DUF3667 domain-containing protein [Chryseobacterium sp. Tr-659]NIF07888.1 DUF3667 domain-containing protein [Chryseobacterium sp. Tr-659]
MSHGKIREDQTCQNCGHQVEERFCPHCGQENIEAIQPFHYLFTHFIEDFTHYDSYFWKTIKYLLFYPGKLTKEYLVGKRQSYVPPVKLYIFVSFITFLLPGLLPTYDDPKIYVKAEVKIQEQKKEILLLQSEDIHQKSKDTLQSKTAKDGKKIIDDTFNTEKESILNANSMKEYDSLLAKDKRLLNKLYYPLVKKAFALRDEGYSKKQIGEKYKKTFIKTIPKALFIYLPVFAFLLWIFHNKKKWLYFDHGIFALHYFSFLLTCIIVIILLNYLTNYSLPDSTFYFIESLFIYAVILCMPVYFFIAHYRIYETKKTISIIKSSLLFIVNIIMLLVTLIILSYISFILIH